ncbi:hypothetical protein X738_24465 [Mesorhizobium sp. LNHC209A00]|nr:hypothetical protein X738_24465 [Mesorhizobium sp. LNHC209A00]
MRAIKQLVRFQGRPAFLPVCEHRLRRSVEKLNAALNADFAAILLQAFHARIAAMEREIRSDN